MQYLTFFGQFLVISCKIIYQIATTKREIPAKLRRGALIVLSMTGRADKEILSNNMDILVKVGIGEAAKVLNIIHSRMICF